MYVHTQTHAHTCIYIHIHIQTDANAHAYTWTLMHVPSCMDSCQKATEEMCSGTQGWHNGWGDLRMTARLTNGEPPLGAPLKVPSAAHPGFFLCVGGVSFLN